MSRSRPFNVFSRYVVPLLSILFLALLVVAPVEVAQAAPAGFGVLQQEIVAPDEPIPDTPSAEILLVLAAQVAGIVEAAKRLYIKPLADRKKWSNNHYIGVLTALAVLLGIGSAFIAGPEADLLRMVGVSFLPPAIGILMSGFLISFGQTAVHWGVDGLRDLVILLRAYANKLQADAEPTAVLSAQSPSGTLAAVIGTPEHEDYLKRFAEALYKQWNNNAGPGGSAPDPVPRSPEPSLN